MSLLTLVAALATSNTCPSNFTQHTKIGLVDGAHLLSAVPAADYTSWCVRTVLPSHILKCCAPHHERSNAVLRTTSARSPPSRRPVSTAAPHAQRLRSARRSHSSRPKKENRTAA